MRRSSPTARSPDLTVPVRLAVRVAARPAPRRGAMRMSALEDWAEALCAELGLDAAADSQRVVLDLARVVAHTVDRPAAPVTAYLLGMAVGRGQPLAETAQRIQQLARGWPEAR